MILLTLVQKPSFSPTLNLGDKRSSPTKLTEKLDEAMEKYIEFLIFSKC
jgi:hypothetical protein